MASSVHRNYFRLHYSIALHSIVGNDVIIHFCHQERTKEESLRPARSRDSVSVCISIVLYNTVDSYVMIAMIVNVMI